jgi:hypothetical protein
MELLGRTLQTRNGGKIQNKILDLSFLLFLESVSSPFCVLGGISESKSIINPVREDQQAVGKYKRGRGET